MVIDKRPVSGVVKGVKSKLFNFTTHIILDHHNVLAVAGWNRFNNLISSSTVTFCINCTQFLAVAACPTVQELTTCIHLNRIVTLDQKSDCQLETQ